MSSSVQTAFCFELGSEASTVGEGGGEDVVGWLGDGIFGCEKLGSRMQSRRSSTRRVTAKITYGHILVTPSNTQ